MEFHSDFWHFFIYFFDWVSLYLLPQVWYSTQYIHGDFWVSEEKVQKNRFFIAFPVPEKLNNHRPPRKWATHHFLSRGVYFLFGGCGYRKWFKIFFSIINVTSPLISIRTLNDLEIAVNEWGWMIIEDTILLYLKSWAE